jgi:ring-1,2-phenylacetyl-CoA epoxidase subunit PaaE
VYGNKTPEDVIFSKLRFTVATCRFFIHSVFSQAKVEHALFGRIDKSTVNYVMNNKHKELEFDKFYLCGETMIEVVTGVLKEKNVKESAIKFELFTASSHENVIQDLEGHENYGYGG